MNDLMKAAMEEARIGKFTLPLKKPLKSGGKTFEKLEFDLSEMSGQDMLDCEAQWAKQYGRTAQVAAQTASFQMILVSRAIGIPVEDLIEGTTIKESVAICNCVVSFLIS